MERQIAAMRSFANGLVGPKKGGGGFNAYSAGAKHYGGGRSFPTSGAVDKLGYAKRDNEARARRNALLRRMQQEQAGNFRSADVNRPMRPGS